METLQAIHTRKSIRAFLSKEVPWDIIRKVLEAGIRAPNGGNRQPWRFVVVTDKSKMRQFDPEFHQPWVENAPAMIVACVDPHDTWESYDEDDQFYILDVAAAIENMLLAIHDLGLGGAWVLSCSRKAIRKALGIPKHWQIVALVPFGYYQPDAVVEKEGEVMDNRSVRPRKPLSQVAFVNSANQPFQDLEVKVQPGRIGLDGP